MADKNHIQNNQSQVKQPAAVPDVSAVATPELQREDDGSVPSPDAEPEADTPNLFPPSTYYFPPLTGSTFMGPEFELGDPNSEIDWFGMSRPYFNRAIPWRRFGDYEAIQERWLDTFRLAQRLGFGADRASWISNQLTPMAIDSALSGDFPTTFELMNREMNLSPTMVNAPAIHFKLEVGQPDDTFEREADAVADQVMRMPDPSIQRKCAECEEEEEKARMKPQITSVPASSHALNRKSSHWLQKQGDYANASIENSINNKRGSGQPIPGETRSFMETRIGVDFENVNIHTDGQSAQLNKSLGAKAFTIGSDIFFNKGQWNPESSEGKHLLAHELTHVVQQGYAHPKIQRATGDGHDLSSPRFAGDATLEEVYDGNQQLGRGESGDPVSKIQHALQDFGIFLRVYGVDGLFEEETERGVRRYQQQKGITTDPSGTVGPDTMATLDNDFPSVTDSATTLSQSPADEACIQEILCPWNRAIIDDFRSGARRVIFVDRLYWADEQYDGTSWGPNPMEGAGETSGNTIRIMINDDCETVTQALYHEYQHARSPMRLSSQPWAAEEANAYSLETSWSISRGLTPDPSLVTTDPNTGETTVDTSGVQSQVSTYPGMVSGVNEEVIAKVGSHKVRVRRGDGTVYIRDAQAGDSVPGPRRTDNPRLIAPHDWPTCPSP